MFQHSKIGRCMWFWCFWPCQCGGYFDPFSLLFRTFELL